MWLMVLWLRGGLLVGGLWSRIVSGLYWRRRGSVLRLRRGLLIRLLLLAKRGIIVARIIGAIIIVVAAERGLLCWGLVLLRLVL